MILMSLRLVPVLKLNMLQQLWCFVHNDVGVKFIDHYVMSELVVLNKGLILVLVFYVIRLLCCYVTVMVVQSSSLILSMSCLLGTDSVQYQSYLRIALVMLVISGSSCVLSCLYALLTFNVHAILVISIYFVIISLLYRSLIYYRMSSSISIMFVWFVIGSYCSDCSG